jgi:hypothetical protein
MNQRNRRTVRKYDMGRNAKSIIKRLYIKTKVNLTNQFMFFSYLQIEETFLQFSDLELSEFK